MDIQVMHELQHRVVVKRHVVHEHIYQRNHQVVVHVQPEILVQDEHSTIVQVINEKQHVDVENGVQHEVQVVVQ